MSYPSWITLSDLGSYPQDQSFDLTPIVIQFSAGTGSSVSVLNGSLPTGLIWTVIGNTVTITGLALPRPETISSRITFRIRQKDGLISDRTFDLTLLSGQQLPSWIGQETFLGYQSNTGVSSYQLNAVSPSGEFIIYDIVTPVAGMALDAYSGVLTYDASSITINTTVSVTVRATAGQGSNEIELFIGVTAVPSAPSWVTDPGSLGVFSGGDFIEITFLAEDPFATVSYSLSSFSPLPFPFVLSGSGLLYGQTESPLTETRYYFTIIATSSNGSSSRSFYLDLVPSDAISLLKWVTLPDLGVINEGEYARLSIQATTGRRTQLIYHVIGGVLPPHLMMNFSTGELVGFCEYHAIDKDYQFDISVTDGYQTIVRQFNLTVKKLYNDQFFQAYIPMISPIRENTLTDVANLRAREPGTVVFNRVYDTPDPPYLNIINGLVTGFDTPDEIVFQASPYLSQLILALGPAANSSPTSDGASYLYRYMEDGQNSANLSVYSSSVFNTNVQTNGIVTPISIENIRKVLLSGRSFVGGGSGIGTVMYPLMDFSDGSLASVSIINPGFGYRSRPEIFVTGSGTGATVKARVGAVSINITDPGQGWAIGDRIEIPGNYDSTPAIAEVSEIGTLGSISSLKIINNGDYLQISAAPFIGVSNGDATASLSPVWGIVSVDVISGGRGYECGIGLEIGGGEILPPWQENYFPAVELGKIDYIVAGAASDILNNEPTKMWGIPWNPNYIVFHWQGVKWFGSTTFETDTTTFDGDTTRFQETEDPRTTVFDDDQTVFNDRNTTFDYTDPLAYDLFQVWGGTLIDQGTTVFDLYSTIFDALQPRRNSKTSLKKWIAMPHRIYSGNNAVW